MFCTLSAEANWNQTDSEQLTWPKEFTMKILPLYRHNLVFILTIDNNSTAGSARAFQLVLPGFVCRYSASVGVNVRVNACLSLYVVPAIHWRSIQAITQCQLGLAPSPPCDPQSINCRDNGCMHGL